MSGLKLLLEGSPIMKCEVYLRSPSEPALVVNTGIVTDSCRDMKYPSQVQSGRPVISEARFLLGFSDYFITNMTTV